MGMIFRLHNQNMYITGSIIVLDPTCICYFKWLSMRKPCRWLSMQGC